VLKKEASRISGGLSAPSKMPCPSYNLPASMCIVGAKLAKIAGTVCNGCYALKGRYRFGNVQAALKRRARSLVHGSWTTALVTLVTGHEYFRWHDSGDLQSVQHLKNIFEVCKQTPNTRHWLPTREHKLLQFLDPDVIPKNLLIRVSATKVNSGPPSWWPWTSTVSTTTKTCPAPDQGGKCRSCRACWDRSVSNVVYAKH
jgi:hypothetical protein